MGCRSSTFTAPFFAQPDRVDLGRTTALPNRDHVPGAFGLRLLAESVGVVVEHLAELSPVLFAFQGCDAVRCHPLGEWPLGTAMQDFGLPGAWD